MLQVSHEAQRKQLAVAVGLQHRHERRYQETIRRLRDGAIGDIVLTRVYRNSEPLLVCPRHRDQTELAFQLRNWPWFTWLGGDFIVDRLVHSLDVINWLKDDYPVSAQGQGGHLAGARSKIGEIFDHHMVEFTYADGSKLVSQCRHVPQTWNRISEHAHGTQRYGRPERGGHPRLRRTRHLVLRPRRHQRAAATIESTCSSRFDAANHQRSLVRRGQHAVGHPGTDGQLLRSARHLGTGPELRVTRKPTTTQFASLEDRPPVLPDDQQEYHIRLPGIARS